VDDFRLIGELTDQETIAEGTAIREFARLVKAYGEANWRKRKGLGTIELATGQVRRRSYTGTRHTASAARNSRSSASLTNQP
jgi:hypothetical protein